MANLMPLGLLLLVAALAVPSATRDGSSASENDCKQSLACQNFRKTCRNKLNNQIRAELNASYTYMSMGAYFSHDEMALSGFAKFFFKASAEEREHAMKMIEYQSQRGGHVEFFPLDAPAMKKWPTGLAAMESALILEKEVNAQLLDLHKVCEGDPAMQDFLVSNFLNEQVESIKNLADHVSRLKKLHQGPIYLGEYIYDKDL